MPDHATAPDDQASGSEPAGASDPTPGRTSTDARTRRRLQVGVVLVALVALVAAGVWYQSSRTSRPSAGGSGDPDSVVSAPLADGVSVGTSGGPVVEVFVDYQCTHCADLEEIIGPELVRLAVDGEAALVISPVKFVSRASGRGAAALYCAAGSDHALAMHQELLADISADFSPEGLAALAGSLGLDAPTFGACLTDQATISWVNGVTDKARSDGLGGIPAVFVDGTRLTDAQIGSAPAFRAAVLASSTDG